MARILKIDLCGCLEASTYAALVRFASELHTLKQHYEEALAEGETIYSWEIPPDVVMLNVNSSGGALLGLLPTMQALRSIAEEIPFVGVASGDACSAGYMLLTACSTIVAVRGTQLGSIAAATAFQDRSKVLEDKGIVPYFFSTHTDKFTGLPGENKSPEDIQNYLEMVATDSFALLQDFMESQRPGIAKEIKRLNGSSFIVKDGSSVLYDLTANSIFEVVTTLDTMESDMFKNILTRSARPSAALMASAQAASSEASSPSASLLASALGTQTKATKTSQEATPQASAVATAEVLMKDSDFIASLGKAIAEAMNVPATKIAPPASTEENTTSSVASMSYLLDTAKALKATEADVIHVAALSLTEETSAKVMQMLVAARDKSQTVVFGNAKLGNVEALKEESSDDDENSLVKAFSAKVAALKARGQSKPTA